MLSSRVNNELTFHLLVRNQLHGTTHPAEFELRILVFSSFPPSRSEIHCFECEQPNLARDIP